MKSIKNVYTLTEQIKDNIAAFGHFEAAKIARKKIPFTLFHFFAFGYLPRVKLTSLPVYKPMTMQVISTAKQVEWR